MRNLFHLLSPGLALIGLCTAMARAQPDEGPVLAPLAQADIAFQMAQSAQNSGAALAVQQIALRLATKQAGLEHLAIARRDLNQKRAVILADPNLEETTRRIRLDEVDVALRVNGMNLAKGFPGYLDIVAPDPMSINEVQAHLSEDEALVLFHQARDYLMIWMVSRDDVIWHHLPMTAQDAATIMSAFRAEMGLDGTLRSAASLDDDGPVAPVRGFDTRMSYVLYRMFFGPFEDRLSRYPHLRLVADKAWIGLPFNTLLTEVEDVVDTPDANHLRRASWLLRKHAITLMPSVVSLRALGPARLRGSDTGGATTLLALGDPVFSGTDSPDQALRAAGNGTVDISQLAPLPGTRREIRAIAAAFESGKSQVLLGAEASETAFREADLSDRDVIVFATHGLISGELQGLAEPALALTPPATPTFLDDGLLTAGEVAGLTLDADWVVLSACNTAAGNGEGAEGLSGLARAFFAAGAKALLVSHWPVRDDAAARLTATAFGEMRADPAMRKSEALRRSMLALMADESDPSLAHPVAWAPFFVVGD